MNIRLKSVALGAALCLASVSFGADQFRFFFGYGDANLASLNNAAVGGAVNPANMLRIPSASDAVNKFKLQVWVEKLSGSSTSLYLGVSTHVAFDRGVASNTGNATEHSHTAR